MFRKFGSARCQENLGKMLFTIGILVTGKAKWSKIHSQMLPLAVYGHPYHAGSAETGLPEDMDMLLRRSKQLNCRPSFFQGCVFARWGLGFY